MKMLKGNRNLIRNLIGLVVVLLLAIVLWAFKAGYFNSNASSDNLEKGGLNSPEADFARDELVIKFKKPIPGEVKSESVSAKASIDSLGTVKKVFQGSVSTAGTKAVSDLDYYYLLKINQNGKIGVPALKTTTATPTNLKGEIENRIAENEKKHQKDILLSLREQIKSNPSVEEVSLNYVRKANWIPNDKYYNTGNSFGTGYDDMWGLKGMGMSSAWDGSRGAGTVVAVVDTGVDVNHEDLASNIFRDSQGRVIGRNFSDSSELGDDYLIDNVGHGTHVAGTIAAVGNNGIGVVGVAPEAKIMPVRVLGDFGGYDSDIAEGIKFAADNGANVINLSLGGLGYSSLMSDALSYAVAKNVTVIAAAGNDGDDAMNYTPAGDKNVITVAALDPNRKNAIFSNIGPKIDVIAPGEDILSTVPPNSRIAQEVQPDKLIDGKYARIDGTSMASPHVAGLAALVISKNKDKNLLPSQVKIMLRNSTDMLNGQQTTSDLYGFGAVNGPKAVNLSPQSSFPEVKINNLNDLYKKTFDIYGTTIGGGGKYQLDYRPVKFSSYSSDLATGLSYKKFFDGSNQIKDGKLGSFLVTVQNDGQYYLRLASQNSAGLRNADFTKIQLAKRQADGFPLINENINPTIDPMTAKLDGTNQSIIATSYASISAYDSKSLQKTWTYNVAQEGDYVAGNIPTRPAVCNLDADVNTKEIVAIMPVPASQNDLGHYFFNQVVALDSKGNKLWSYNLDREWADFMSFKTTTGVFLCDDFDRNGTNEIAFTEGDESRTYSPGHLNLIVLDNNGKVFKKVPLAAETTGETFNGYATSGDINNDGKKELAISFSVYDGSVSEGDHPCKTDLHIYDSQMNLLWKMDTVKADFSYIGSLEIADFSGDKKKDLLYSVVQSIDQRNFGTTFYNIQADGKILSKFSQLNRDFFAPVVPVVSPGAKTSYFTTFREGYDKNYFKLFPSSQNFADLYSETGDNSIAAISANIDNDSSEELIILNPSEGPRIIKNNKLLEKFYAGGMSYSGSISDANLDGKTDLSVSSNNYGFGQSTVPGVYLFEFNSVYNPSTSSTWPMSCHDSKRTCSL